MSQYHSVFDRTGGTWRPLAKHGIYALKNVKVCSIRWTECADQMNGRAPQRGKDATIAPTIRCVRQNVESANTDLWARVCAWDISGLEQKLAVIGLL